MADENLNNNNEETAALFVSAQKKKKAEEEARQKAAEEQAKRDAAEAEVRRMEQEVEERKRKAEEEKKALEEARSAAAAAGDKPQQVKEAAMKAVEKASEKAAEVKKSGKLPMPAIIGAAAAVVVIILIAVFALGGKGNGGGADSSAILSAEFKAEYETKADAAGGLKFSYPESIYTEVTEEDIDGAVGISFTPAKKGTPLQLIVGPLGSDGEGLTKGGLALMPPKELVKVLAETSKAMSEAEGITVADEQGTDLTAEVPDRYYSSFTFTQENKENGAAYAWIKPGSGDTYMLVMAMVQGKSEPADLMAVCKKFADENAKDALMVPGAKPPTSTEIDGMLTVDGMHMGIHMPNGQFVRCPELDGDEYCVFGDENGAMILVNYAETDLDFEAADTIRDSIYDIYKSMAESGLANIYPNIEGRMFLNDQQNSMNRYEYYADYRDTISGLTYWEGFYANHWRDVRTQKYYFYEIIMLAPELNKDAYYNLFMKSLDRLDDI